MSETAQRSPISAPAAKLGGELRARRQTLGWELPELSQSLRIRQPYLEAIEGGRMSELPGNTYALGFVRAYASALGLNGEQIASRFRAESAEASIRPALSFPAPVPQRGVPAGALMLLGLLILGASYAGWYYVSEHERTPAETVPPIPDHLLPSAEKPTPSPQVASILPSASPPAPRQVVPSTTPANPAPSSAAATQAATASSAALSPAPVIPAPAIAPAPAPAAAPPAPSGTRIIVKATADAWVTIKQPNGPPLLNKLMQAGETWPVPADKPGLTLTSGNAGGTELDVDKTQIATLGPSGAVRRDLKLDPDALKAGPLPPIPHGHVKPAPAPQG
jgi:cytoskeleton protein RodZ